MVAVRPAVGTGSRTTIRCLLGCKTSPTGVCTCPVAEAAPNGVLILRQEHSVVGRGSTRFEPQKHETQISYSELVVLTLSASTDPKLLMCGVGDCGREVGRITPGGLLELTRNHYGETHVRRLTLFELTRLLLDADARSMAEPPASPVACQEGD